MASPVGFAGSIPGNYDHYLGPLLFEPYAVDLAKRLPAASTKVLELACGTGRVTKHLIKSMPHGSTLVATDLNVAMIDIARNKIREKNIEWMVADAQELPFQENYFDAVVCQFGVMFFPDKPKAFSEAKRVIKPGGSFIFNTWDSVQNNPPIVIITKVLEEVLGNEAPDFLQKGPHGFYNEATIKTLMEGAGFKNIKWEALSIQSSYRFVDDVVKGFLQGTPLAGYLLEKNETKRQQIKEKLRAAFVDTYGESSDNFPCRAFVCEGTA